MATKEDDSTIVWVIGGVAGLLRWKHLSAPANTLATIDVFGYTF